MFSSHITHKWFLEMQSHLLGHLGTGSMNVRGIDARSVLYDLYLFCVLVGMIVCIFCIVFSFV